MRSWYSRNSLASDSSCRLAGCATNGRRRRCLLVFLTLGIAMVGCNRPKPSLAPTKPAEVLVSLPVAKEVTDFEDFTGRTEAVATIEVRARVTGYLDKVLFKEGTEVKLGDPLFEIDRRTYQADYDRAEANLLQARAHLNRLQADLKRAASLLPSKSISQEDYDKVAGDCAEAEAGVKVSEAALHSSRLSLEFTIVTAPISGRISRQLIDPGNMVKADETPLTMLVSLDPIYAYFDVDERTMLRIRRLIRQGKVKSAREAEVSVLLGLADEEGFPHSGTINFIENRVDRTTGTLGLRGIVANPKRLFSPGMFLRVRVPIGDPHRAILVSERALGSDQGQKFVYILNDKNEVTYRRVKVGALETGLRVVEDGLAMGERVVVTGLQRIRPGAQVVPRMVAMTAQEPAAAPPSAAKAETAKAETGAAPATPTPVATPGPAAKAESASTGRPPL